MRVTRQRTMSPADSEEVEVVSAAFAAVVLLTTETSGRCLFCFVLRRRWGERKGKEKVEHQRRRKDEKKATLTLSLTHLSRRRRSLFDFHAPGERGDDGAGAEMRAGSGGVGRLGDLFGFVFREVEVEFFFFFFQERSRRSTSSKEFLLARFLSLPRLGLCAWERATITKKANGSTDLWEENVAWGGEGGHEKIDLQKFRMQGKGGALERAENRKKVRSCLCSLRCSASKNSKKKPDFFFFASNLQTHFRNSNHALLLQVELAPGQGRGPRARRCRAQRVHVSEGD